MGKEKLGFCALLTLALVLFVGQFAFSMFVVPPPPYDENVVISFSANAGGNSGQVELYISPEEWILLNPTDDPSQYRWNYEAEGSTDIFDNATGEIILGSLDTFSLTVKLDPSVSLSFAATAGNSSTTFGFSSASVSFAPITDPDAVASASITVTDNNGDGATVSGAFAGGEMYQALYNNPAVVWAQLLNSTVAAGAYSSNTASDRRPSAGMEQIPATVDQISSAYSFTLSALDSASGTSTFTVVPEPATIALLALGALAFIRKKA